MTSEGKLLALHLSCVLTIVGCFTLSESVFRASPMIAQALVGAGFFLWGKLGFKPARSVFERLIQALEPAEVEQIMSTRPPPLVIPAPPQRRSAHYRPAARAPKPPKPRGHDA